MKFKGPKVKLSRKLGIALTPKAIKYMEKRPYPPGQHGPNKGNRARKSEYGLQLLEKQRLRFQYNVSEKQMRNYFKKALRKKGLTGEVLVQLLESRLDAVVLRAGYAMTIFAARQYVNHGHIEVNNKRVDIPSYQVKPGDYIAVKLKSRKMKPIEEAMLSASSAPPYVERDWVNMGAYFKYVPPREEIPVICEVEKVVEYYSK